ncbi:hypothetical protein ACN47E_007925 [Coniothyrium glycines]
MARTVQNDVNLSRNSCTSLPTAALYFEATPAAERPEVAQDQAAVVVPKAGLVDVAASASADEVRGPPATQNKRPTSKAIIEGWTTVIRTINGKDHLLGLKRTGGGVGSSRHDASQKSIETFFKRRKVD